MNLNLENVKYYSGRDMFELHKISSIYNENARIVLNHGDTAASVQSLPSETFRLIVSSPPYNIGKSYEKQTALDDYLSWQSEIARELVRLIAPNGSLVWQVGNYVEKGEVFPLDMFFYPMFKSLGLILRNRIVWHFDHGLHAKKRFSGRYETLLWFTKSDEYVFNLDEVRIPAKYPGKLHYKGKKKGLPSGNPLGKNPSDFWNIISSEWDSGIIDIPNVKANHPEKSIHPCQFPIELIERFVLALTNEDDWVLDPFGGVASSLIAAIKHSRRGMVIDKEERYIEIARQRVIDFQNGNLKIRPIGKEIYKPSGKEKVAQRPNEWNNLLEK